MDERNGEDSGDGFGEDEEDNNDGGDQQVHREEEEGHLESGQNSLMSRELTVTQN